MSVNFANHNIINDGFNASPTGIITGTNAVVINDGQTILSHGNFSADGDAQSSSYILRCTTTNATFTTAQNNGADILIPNDTSIMFIASITGRRTDQVNAANSDNASYKLIGLLHNDGGGIALLGSVSKTVIAETDSNWDVQAAVTGSGSSGSDKLNIQCKGASSKTVNWLVKLETVEVKGGEHSSSSLTIAKISDGSSSYAVEVVFSLSTLPTGTTQLKYTISGTGSTSTVGTSPTSTASNTTHNGTGGTSSFRSRYNSSTNQGRFYHGPGDDVTNISLTVEALNSSSTTLGTSNTLTGLVIDEDG